MNFRLLHPRDQLLAIMNRIYHNGMTTLSGGNLYTGNAPICRPSSMPILRHW